MEKSSKEDVVKSSPSRYDSEKKMVDKTDETSSSQQVKLPPPLVKKNQIEILDRFTQIPNFMSYYEQLRKEQCTKIGDQMKEYFRPAIVELRQQQRLCREQTLKNREQFLKQLKNFQQNIHAFIHKKLIPKIDEKKRQKQVLQQQQKQKQQPELKNEEESS